MTRILSIYVLSGALAVLVVAVPSSADAIEIKTPQVAMPHVNVPHVTTPQVNTHVITPQVKLHVIPPEGSTGSKITDTNSGAGTPTSTGPSGGAVWQGPVTINGPSGAGAEVRSETVGGTPVAIDGPHLLGSGNNPNSGGGSLLQPVVVNHQLPKGGTGLHLPPIYLGRNNADAAAALILFGNFQQLPTQVGGNPPIIIYNGAGPSPLNTFQGRQNFQNAFNILRNSLDSDNEVSEMTSMRLQMLMTNRSTLLQAASDLEKTNAATERAIVGNIKQ